MLLETIKVGELETNCYIFGDKNGEAVVIDPGDNADVIMQNVNKHNCTIKYIVLTHGHFDHIGAVAALKKQTQAKVIIHELDADCLTDATRNLSYYMGMPEIQIEADSVIKEGEIIEAGNRKLTVIHTPGHTAGSICLKAEEMLFSGDTLFKESAGRTDLPGGSSKQIMESINEKLMKLDDAMLVYPGHSECSTIGYERKHNPFVEKC